MNLGEKMNSRDGVVEGHHWAGYDDYVHYLRGGTLIIRSCFQVCHFLSMKFVKFCILTLEKNICFEAFEPGAKSKYLSLGQFSQIILFHFEAIVQ